MTTLALALALSAVPQNVKPKPLPPLRVVGKRFVDTKGKPVLLKGANLGNWHLIEFWMLALGDKALPDQWTLVESLKSRFGEREADRLMDLYRSSWITERDWRNIKSYNFNVVRLPMDYRLMEDDERPMQLRKDAWQWVDRAVDDAERHGLYVILDLHGVQGGQTPNDHTGRSGQNKLWGNEENKKRKVWLWTQIARRYKNRSAVVAYDTMNEPYGGQKPEIKEIFARTYRAIRREDPKKLIYAHGWYDTFTFFGSPKENGWTNVGYQMHYYPGLFGSAPRVQTHVEHFRRLEEVAKVVDEWNVPFLIGEMNVVLESSGGASMMRRTFDIHDRNGWTTTMWSYKVMSGGGDQQKDFWGMFGNKAPAPQIDLRTASKPEIEAYFRSFATMELVPYRALQTVLTAKNPILPPLPEPAPIRTTAPDEAYPGWARADMGTARKGGLGVGEGTRFDLYGGGEDIWGEKDSFRFLHREVSGDFAMSVVVEGIEEAHEYTKAGLMIRASLEPGAPSALLGVLAGGRVQLALRSEKDRGTEGVDGPGIPVPNGRIELRRVGETLVFSAEGREFARRTIPGLKGKVFVGPVALSHANDRLAKIGYRDLTLVTP